MITRTMTSLAGNLRSTGWISLAVFLASCTAAYAQVQPGAPPASTPPAVVATATPSADRESSLTVQQIVARQEDHFARLQNARGTAVHSEVRYNEQGQPQPATEQYIFFAYNSGNSVTLAMPKQAAQLYKGSQGQVPWQHVTSAFLITGDTVYSIRKSERGTSVPTVLATPFNPAVHENNPLVSFHPRQISDEQIPLRDLVRAIPQMNQRPKVYDITRDGKPMLKVEFANPQTPSESLHYIIDPARGYLPVEIARTSNGRAVSLSRIVIGHTPDGIWIPARRERVIYNAQGKQASRQNWHFDFFSANQDLPPKIFSLMYFNLPLTTPVTKVGDGGAARPAQGSAQQTPGGTRQPAASPAAPAVPTATPIPPRIAPAPMRVPLQ